jgi:hypothetical protein
MSNQSEPLNTTALIQALSRMFDNRHSDGTSSIVSAEDRSTIINTCQALTLAARQSAQVQHAAGTVEAFDKDHPELYWHIAKGKITAGEPLYGAIITDLRGNELGHGESDESAIDAFNIAVSAAAPAKHEAGQ